MNYERILILHSYKESIEKREEVIKNNPELNGMLFSHCWVIDLNRGGKIKKLKSLFDEMKWADNMFHSVIQSDINELLGRIVIEDVKPELEKEIVSFNPDVVIVHCSVFFEWTPHDHLRMVEDLLQKHPGLRIALQGKQKWLSGLSEEDNFQSTLIRRAKAAFIDDNEIEKIIEHIF